MDEYKRKYFELLADLIKTADEWQDRIDDIMNKPLDACSLEEGKEILDILSKRKPRTAWKI